MLVVDLHDDGWAVRWSALFVIGCGMVCNLLGVDDDQTREIQRADLFAIAIDALDAKAKGAGGVDERIRRIRWRELLDQQTAVEGLTIQRAEATQRPDYVLDGKCKLLGAPGRQTRACGAQEIA